MTLGTANARGLTLLAHHDLGGHGDGMQVQREGDALYVGHTGTSRVGTSILDVSDPGRPELVVQMPAPDNTHTHKVQVADGLLLVNHESYPMGRPPQDPYSAGLAVYSLADPFAPERIGFWDAGGRGVHRIVWTGGRYAHMSARPEGFNDRIWVVIDMADPTNPVEAARWWWPGQNQGADEQPTWPEGERYAAHHALLDGDIAYLGYDDANMVVLDVSDWTQPRQLEHVVWGGGSTHTCLPLPGRRLVVATDEQQTDGPGAPVRDIYLIDVATAGAARVLGTVPRPDASFDALPMRFGPHNLHENRAGSYRSERLVFSTWFNAGVRVYDLADPANPVEVAHWVPETPAGQDAPASNDLWVDHEGLIWVTDRHGGALSVLQPDDELAALMREAALPQ